MRHFSTHDLHQEGKNSFNRPSLERQKKNNPLKNDKIFKSIASDQHLLISWYHSLGIIPKIRFSHSPFGRINFYSLSNHQKTDDFRGNRSYFIRLNSLNVRNDIW